jgi:hypothetical protein
VVLVLFVAAASAFVDAYSSSLPDVDEGGHGVNDGVPDLMYLPGVPSSKWSIKAFVFCCAISPAKEFAPDVPGGRGGAVLSGVAVLGRAWVGVALQCPVADLAAIASRDVGKCSDL